LEQRPDATLCTAWQAYVQALVATLDVKAREALKTELLGRARTVADAAGGILGFGSRISKAEQTKLAMLEQAFA
jgi:hypothetical protein